MKIVIALSILCAFLPAHAQEMLEKTLSGSSTAANPVEARRQILDETSLKLTEELARELLGEERFRKHQSVISGKVAKASGRYIPFTKPGALGKNGDGSYSMSVTMKASVASLRQVLQEAGLLNENTTSPILLPVVSFVDRVNSKTERWWLEEDRGGSPFLRTLQKRFETALRKNFRKGGFHVWKPQGAVLTRAVPEALRGESPSPADLQLLGDWFGARW